MMTDLTTREVSQRLKDAGFSADYIYEWVEYIKDALPAHLHDIRDELGMQKNIISRKSPAYSASTLFEYLRENHGKIPALDFDLWTIYAYGEGSFEPIADYKTSLADMLGESIIWILTQEKENK